MEYPGGTLVLSEFTGGVDNGVQRGEYRECHRHIRASWRNVASLFTGNANLRGIGHPAMFTPSQLYIGFYRNRCIEEQGRVANCLADMSPTGYDARERIDGPSGDAAQTFTAAIPVSGASKSPRTLLIRYFSAPALNGSSEVWLWKDRVTSGPAASVSVAVYDEDRESAFGHVRVAG